MTSIKQSVKLVKMLNKKIRDPYVEAVTLDIPYTDLKMSKLFNRIQKQTYK